MATRTIPIQVEQDNFLTALMMAVLFAGLTWAGTHLVGWGLFNISIGGQFKAGLLGALHSIIPFRQGLEASFDQLAGWAAANKPIHFAVLHWTPLALGLLTGAGTFWVFHSTFKSSAHGSPPARSANLGRPRGAGRLAAQRWQGCRWPTAAPSPAIDGGHAGDPTLTCLRRRWFWKNTKHFPSNACCAGSR